MRFIYRKESTPLDVELHLVKDHTWTYWSIEAGEAPVTSRPHWITESRRAQVLKNSRSRFSLRRFDQRIWWSLKPSNIRILSDLLAWWWEVSSRDKEANGSIFCCMQFLVFCLLMKGFPWFNALVGTPLHWNFGGHLLAVFVEDSRKDILSGCNLYSAILNRSTHMDPSSSNGVMGLSIGWNPGSYLIFLFVTDEWHPLYLATSYLTSPPLSRSLSKTWDYTRTGLSALQLASSF